MDERRISEEYTEIGKRVIEKMPELSHLRNADVQIMFLAGDCRKKSGGHPVLGQCERVPEKYRWCVPCDFTVTVFEPNVRELSGEQLEILLFHELLHIGIRNGKFVLIPHDCEDFMAVLNKYGADWASPGKTHDREGTETVSEEVKT